MNTNKCNKNEIKSTQKCNNLYKYFCNTNAVRQQFVEMTKGDNNETTTDRFGCYDLNCNRK